MGGIKMSKYENVETKKRMKKIIGELEEIQKEAKQLLEDHKDEKMHLKVKSQILLELTDIFIGAALVNYNKKNWYE
jgi:hypothetical protein